MRKYFRKAAISTICMLVVAIMSLTGATYAWFSSATSAQVDGFEMTVGSAGAGLQVSANGTSWSSDVTLTDASKENVQPSSTVDGVNFYTATVDVDNSDTITSISAANVEDVAIIKDFWIRNTGSNSLEVTLKADVFTTTKTDAALAKVVKCARIGLFDASGNLLWVYGDIDHTYGIASAKTGNYSVTTASEGVIVALNTEKFTSDANACTLNVPADDSGAQYTVKVWLEGQDPQCLNSVALSDFAASLTFSVGE